MFRKSLLVFSSLCLSLSLALGVLATTFTTASASLDQVSMAAGSSKTPTPTLTRTPTRTPTLTPRPTRPVPTIRLKLPPDGQGVEVGIADPNFSSKGMKAMAFQALARVTDPEQEYAKISGVEFTVYSNEDDLDIDSLEQFDEFIAGKDPVYQHTEKNNPYCIFSDSNGKCNKVKVQQGKSWPKSDDASITPTPYREGSYFLVATVQADEGGSFFWRGVIEFKLKPVR
jgi:hypothetical protein